LDDRREVFVKKHDHHHPKEIITMPVKPIPDGYHTATPYLIVSGAAGAIDFYKTAFGATELFRMPMPNGKIGHAEIKIGNSIIMLADESPEMGARGPKTIGGTASSILLYVEDVDARFNKAIAAGGKVLRPLKNQFYGDRSGTLEDPFGHTWHIGTHIEDVPPDEMHKRMATAMQEKSG
jgi:PhnB protein